MKCPYCGKPERWKWNRPGWMHFTPGPMELWRCASCGKEFTVWWWVFPVQTHVARKLVSAWWLLAPFLLLFLVSFFLLPS